MSSGTTAPTPAAPGAPPRDYSLTGPEQRRAAERGLVGADWWLPTVDREEMLAIMRRRDWPAAWHTVVWLALLVAAGAWVAATWRSWWSIPACLVYGTLYGSVSDARWHECGHRTAFRTRWLNDAVYQVASFMDLREPVSWRWSHHRHHADTLIVGRDPEIAFQRPIRWRHVVAELFALRSFVAEMRKYAANVLGRLHPEEADYVPPREAARAIRGGRIHAAIWAATVVAAVASRSMLPLVLVGLPSLYGRWLLVVYGATQHAGMDEDVLDHRRNTRTVLMNPVSRWAYMNMNYHLEHHMFPSVPFHALPRLHALVRDQLPAPFPSIVAAYRAILPALHRQRRGATYAMSPGATAR
jgi:fatty acid desaturase